MCKQQFTKNGFFVYQNYHSMVKVSNSGYTKKLIEFFDHGNPYLNITPFTHALRRLYDFKRVLIDGASDCDFRVNLEEFRYNDSNVRIRMTLWPQILDYPIFTITGECKFEDNFKLHDAINFTKNVFMLQWKEFIEKILTSEYMDDLEELISLLTNDDIKNRDFK